MRRRVSMLVLAASWLILGGQWAGREAGLRKPRPILPPSQPAQGPGSNDYAHEDRVAWSMGLGGEAFHVFEPAAPTPASAPVTIFLHGFAAVDPRFYIGWIDHIVRRGSIVIFPVYQTADFDAARTYTPNTLLAVERALEVLETPGHVAPQRDRVAVIGHSLGGAIATNYAAAAGETGLPVPGALFLANAADSTAGDTPFQSILDDYDLRAIPADILLLAVIGDDDTVVGDGAAASIFEATPQIPADNKEIIRLYSDAHGTPNLRATHGAPGSMDLELMFDVPDRDRDRTYGTIIDALDYYGYWKWYDGMCDAAFLGTNREYALGNTFHQTFMGAWSDGTPVTAAEVLGP